MYELFGKSFISLAGPTTRPEPTRIWWRSRPVQWRSRKAVIGSKGTQSRLTRRVIDGIPEVDTLPASGEIFPVAAIGSAVTEPTAALRP